MAVPEGAVAVGMVEVKAAVMAAHSAAVMAVGGCMPATISGSHKTEAAQMGVQEAAARAKAMAGVAARAAAAMGAARQAVETVAEDCTLGPTTTAHKMAAVQSAAAMVVGWAEAARSEVVPAARRVEVRPVATVAAQAELAVAAVAAAEKEEAWVSQEASGVEFSVAWLEAACTVVEVMALATAAAETAVVMGMATAAAGTAAVLLEAATRAKAVAVVAVAVMAVVMMEQESLAVVPKAAVAKVGMTLPFQETTGRTFGGDPSVRMPRLPRRQTASSRPTLSDANVIPPVGL